MKKLDVRKLKTGLTVEEDKAVTTGVQKHPNRRTAKEKAAINQYLDALEEEMTDDLGDWFRRLYGDGSTP
jgi:hypothetical protein